MDYLYRVYTNVIKMITQENYRNMDLIDPQLSQKDFENKIQIDRYIIINVKSSKTVESKENIESFYLVHHRESFTRKVPEFKKIVNKVAKNIRNIYFVSDKGFSPHVSKLILSMRIHFNIRLYDYGIFSYEIPKNVLCSKHEIMKEEEIKQLEIDHNLVSRLELAKIRENDPQCIWIGAKVADTIRITRNNMSGESLNYRIVIGATATKVVSSSIPVYLGPNYARPKITIPTLLEKPLRKSDNSDYSKKGPKKKGTRRLEQKKKSEKKSLLKKETKKEGTQRQRQRNSKGGNTKTKKLKRRGSGGVVPA